MSWDLVTLKKERRKMESVILLLKLTRLVEFLVYILARLQIKLPLTKISVILKQKRKYAIVVGTHGHQVIQNVAQLKGMHVPNAMVLGTLQAFAEVRK